MNGPCLHANESPATHANVASCLSIFLLRVDFLLHLSGGASPQPTRTRAPLGLQETKGCTNTYAVRSLSTARTPTHTGQPPTNLIAKPPARLVDPRSTWLAHSSRQGSREKNPGGITRLPPGRIGLKNRSERWSLDRAQRKLRDSHRTRGSSSRDEKPFTRHNRRYYRGRTHTTYHPKGTTTQHRTEREGRGHEWG